MKKYSALDVAKMEPTDVFVSQTLSQLALSRQSCQIWQTLKVALQYRLHVKVTPHYFGDHKI